MALDIDGFAVLRSIGTHHSAFPDVAAEVSKVARTLVTKQIKAKGVELKSLRGVSKAIGADSFNLILDGIPDTQITSLAGKLDKYHPDLKASNMQWRREHVRALAAGSIEPTVKPPSAPKRQKGQKAVSTSPSTPELISYRSAGAKRKK